MQRLFPLLFLLGLLLAHTPAATAQAAAGGLVATTEAGQVRGQRVGSVLVFKSIPYAAPPVGELRFAASAPHQPWLGVRDATTGGPTAPFSRPPAGAIDGQAIFGPGWVKGDDCLTTNVFTSALTGPARSVLYFPVVDGDIVPAVPLTSVQPGASGTVDVLVGYNSDVVNYFLVPSGLLKNIKSNFVLTLAAKRLHPAPAALVTVYKQAYPTKSLGELLSAMATAYQFQVPSVRLAAAHARPSARPHLHVRVCLALLGGRQHLRGLPRAGAALRLQPPRTGNGAAWHAGPHGGPAELAEKMQDAWVEFAKTGSPGWAPDTPAERQTMLLNATWQLQTNPHAKETPAPVAAAPAATTGSSAAAAGHSANAPAAAPAAHSAAPAAR